MLGMIALCLIIYSVATLNLALLIIGVILFILS